MAGTEVGVGYLTITPSARGFGADLHRQIVPEVAKAGTDAGESASKGFGSRFSAGMKTAALAGAAALVGATAAAGDFVRDSIAEARESQKVNAVTEQIIKSTGAAAKISADQIGELTAAISAKTGIDDEAIQSGSNLLLTFKNVRNEVGAGNDIFNRATAAAVDLSATGFGSIESGSKMLGKALNDPVKGIAALSRAGVTFTDQQKEQIKTLVESGKTLDAQKIILKEVESQVGGTAEASATMGEKLSTSVGNFKELVGTGLLPILDRAQEFLVKQILPALTGFVKGMQDGTGAGGQFAAILTSVSGAAQAAYSFIKDNADILVPLAAGLGVAIGLYKAWQIATVAYTAAQTLLNVVLAANPIGIVILAVAALVAGIVVAYQKSETFRNIVDGAFKAVAAAGRFMWEDVLKPVFRFMLDTFLGVAEGILKGAAKAFSWVPGIGPKLEEAAARFEEFRADVNRSLSGIEGRSVTVGVKFAAGTKLAYDARHQGLATGGPVFGAGTETSDSIPALLSNNEHVFTAAEVRAAGGHDAVIALRRWILRAKGMPALPALAGGGGVNVNTSIPSAASISSAASAGLMEVVAANVDRLRRAFEALNMFDGGMMPPPAGGKVAGWQAQWAWLKAAYPGAALYSSYRPGAITATGNRSYHSMGRAVDVTPNMTVFNLIARAFGSSIKELIFSPAGAAQIKNGSRHFYGEPVRSGHWDHVHWAMSQGGPIRHPKLLDAGGILRKGDIGVHLRNDPDYVMTQQQWNMVRHYLPKADQTRARPVRQVVFNGPIGWDPERIARELHERERDELVLTGVWSGGV